MKIQDLQIGSKIIDYDTKYNNSPICWIKVANDHYNNGGNLLVSENIISLKPFDAMESKNPNSNIRDYGSNDWNISNIRQWLNSDRKKWYSQQTEYDQIPDNNHVWNGTDSYDKEFGFLTNFSQVLKQNLIQTEIQTKELNSTKDKVFLLSATELGIESNSNDGKYIEYFKNDELRKKYPTKECVEKSEYKSNEINTLYGWYYLTRTKCKTGSYDDVRLISPGGSSSYDRPRSSNYGVVPAININPNLKVTKLEDIDYYVISYDIYTVLQFNKLFTIKNNILQEYKKDLDNKCNITDINNNIVSLSDNSYSLVKW